MSTADPVIVGFLCTWCAYRAADAAGLARISLAPNMRPLRVMCSGRVDPEMVLKAFREGADGVLIVGCRPGACHYVDGGLKALKRVTLLRRLLPQLGSGKRAGAAGLGGRVRGRGAGGGDRPDDRSPADARASALAADGLAPGRYLLVMDRLPAAAKPPCDGAAP